MNFFRSLDHGVAAPGLERRILRRLPGLTVAVSLAPLVVAVLARFLFDDGTSLEIAKRIRYVDFFCIAFVATMWTAIFTVAIGCVVVMVMKGPAYTADSYEVSHADKPGSDDDEADNA